jgi:hypothetical protein
MKESLKQPEVGVAALVADEDGDAQRAEAPGAGDPKRNVEQEEVQIIPSKKEYAPGEVAELLGGDVAQPGGTPQAWPTPVATDPGPAPTGPTADAPIDPVGPRVDTSPERGPTVAPLDLGGPTEPEPENESERRWRETSAAFKKGWT